MSMFQIYKESITDLLSPATEYRNKDSKPSPTLSLDLREHPTKGIVVDGLGCHLLTSATDAHALVIAGLGNRVTRSVTANELSSRSHVVLQLFLTSQELIEEANSGQRVRRNVLSIIDLAGSERVGKTGSLYVAERFDEAKAINKSIASLGMCIQALAAASDKGDKNAHIPFRNSKLTRLLADSLGGTARACVIATVGPCLLHVEETLSTMRFASRYASVSNNAR